MKTHMSSDTKLIKDEECEPVDTTKYRGMIGCLLYLMASRADIMFSVCLCARFQEDPKTSYLEAVKRIFRYIKSTTHLGLWYPKGTGIETVVYADSGHTGDYVDRKSTSGICTFVGCCLTSWFSKKQPALAISTIEAEYVKFSQILHIPYEGDCSFSDKWSLDDLPYSVPTDGPYQTNPPSPNDIKLLVQIERQDVVYRIRLEQEIVVEYNQILTREITNIIKIWVDIIRENIFCLGGNRDHVPVCLCHMLFCIATSRQYNLAYFIAKRMEFVTKQERLIPPYGMLLTHLFEHVVSENPELSNYCYVLYDRVMYPLTAQQERKTRKDYGIKRGHHSTSSSSAFCQPSSSHLNDDDENDEGT
ncbi:hypothetical protein Tco_0420802 [Tanacetum coccineum]